LARQVWGDEFFFVHRTARAMRSANARARVAFLVASVVITASVAIARETTTSHRVDGAATVKSRSAGYKEPTRRHGGRSGGGPSTTSGGSTDPTTASPTTNAPRTTLPPTTTPPATTPPATSPPATSPPETAPPATNPPTTDPPAQPVLLWSSGMENGSVSDWSRNSGGGLYNSGSYSAGASTDAARSGSWSLKATINTSGGTSGVRAFRWAEPRAHRAAYYSAWLYIPTAFTLTHDPNTGQFWNVFQFKSRTTDGSRNDPVWAFYAQQDAGGLYLKAGWGWGGTQLAGPRAGDGIAGKYFSPLTKVYVPAGRWVHLEAYLNQSKDFDGQMKFWQDGTLLYDFSGVRTSYNNCDYNGWCADNEWSVNLYSDGLSPNPGSAYFDDAAIATSYIR
jgi:hypothetical protein